MAVEEEAAEAGYDCGCKKMMGHKGKLQAQEWDAFTGWRKVMSRPGGGGWHDVKKRYSRRLRRQTKQDLRDDFDE